ncbi:glycosyltransferase family 4 protein [Enterobacter bugandensis]|uniref:glycosyltransferase family 4 protein n=1 Tax=Enterobacter bugandensis TaxID=881260 RepID=UPI00283A9D4E|nr:glycosyltransferase family 4 protein [Enterobacter bugandensis]WMU71371.1 glycosyltransferase family 4 protein [Enterobacter bugandensis]
MKILLIGNQSSTIILFRKKLIKELVTRGIKVHVLVMDNDKGNFQTISMFGAVPEQYYFSRSGMNPLSDLINMVALSKKIRHINPDVVFCFFPKPVIFGTLAAKLAGVKNIYNLLEGLGFCYTAHFKKDSFKKRLLKTIQTFLYKLTLPRAKKVLFLNRDDYQDLVVQNNIEISDFEVIGGIGVDLNDYSYNKPKTDAIHFGMVSRLLVEKGVREFVQAAKIVKSKFPQVRFSIAGAIDDNPGGISRDQLNNWKNEGHVEFLGQISDVKSYLIDLSVFVLPSYREGIPRSTQEAMSIGRAIITTDVPGCRETIVHGKNGLMVPPWDVEALASAMTSVINNSDQIVSMGIESRRIAEEKFDDKTATEKLINILITHD